QFDSLPDAATRANKVLGFTADGTPVAVIPADGSAAAVALALSSYQEQLSSFGPDSPGTDHLGYRLSGVGTAARLASLKLGDYVTSYDFENDDGTPCAADGVNYDDTALQAGLEYTAGMFNQSAFPPAGAKFNKPTFVILPGAYRLRNTLKTYPGVTVMGMGSLAYTVESTRLIMDTLGGTVNLDTHILAPTRNFQGAVRTGAYTGTIENIGFWIVNPGATVAGRGGVSFGPSSNVGSCIYFAEPCIDVRIRGCNFYTTPNAAIWFNYGDASASFDAEISDCEFDTSARAVRTTRGTLNLRLYNNQWYGGGYHVLVEAGKGILKIDGGIMQLQSRILVTDSSDLDLIQVTNIRSDGAGALGNWLEIGKVRQVQVTGNTIGVCSGSAIIVTDADGGVIAGNTINDAGYNATVGDATTDAAAIRLNGCQDLVVGPNSILTRDSATYNGFGIITQNTTRATRVHFGPSVISSAYNGPLYRGQSRHFNVVPGGADTWAGIIISNGGGAKISISLETPVARYEDRTSQVMAAGNYDIPLAGLSGFDAVLTLAALSSALSMTLGVKVRRNYSDGSFVIDNVTKGTTFAAGLGPHALATGNTVTLSISGTNLRLTFAVSTDPMVLSSMMRGVKV
ncbi:MAG: hypothetical protein JWQ89_2520, partial [Devosia sp.]|uniref:hypothetical protein n=1 Tax=Devosia sp. TaxID=1871048 RepID=UPI002610187F